LEESKGARKLGTVLHGKQKKKEVASEHIKKKRGTGRGKGLFFFRGKGHVFFSTNVRDGPNVEERCDNRGAAANHRESLGFEHLGFRTRD